jgi:hypothetical protein
VKDVSTTALRRRRRGLLRQLPSLEQLLRGSLIERYKRCGRPGCHCANGRGHGPKFYLSISTTGQRPRTDYVPNAAVAQSRQYLANFHKVRELINEICAINAELLRRREPFE